MDTIKLGIESTKIFAAGKEKIIKMCKELELSDRFANSMITLLYNALENSYRPGFNIVVASYKINGNDPQYNKKRMVQDYLYSLHSTKGA